MKRLLQNILAVTLLGAFSAMAQMPAVRGEPSLTPKDFAAAPKLRIQAPQAVPVVRLAPVAESEMLRIRQANRNSQKQLRVGIVRSMGRAAIPSARDLAWIRVDTGYAAQVSVSSPQAGAMRLAIDLAGVPLDVEMVVFGSDAPGRLVGPVRVGEIADRSKAWWTPITDGDTQTVEFFVPARYNPSALALKVVAASHVFTTIASAMRKRTSEIGDAGACNVDIKCSSLQSSQAFLDARNAVAQMVFNDGGFTSLCTGSLLNDTDPSSQTPWFFGANHCFENENLPYKTASQMQSVADTLNTLWFFEAIACDDRSVPPYMQLARGAAFIYNNQTADVLFLRLNDTAPAGAFFTGWDPNAISAGIPVVTVHHPQGDLKKVTEGTVQGFSRPPVLGGGSTSFIEVHWSLGTTEGGSSGAPLWTFDGSQYYLRGGLWGGTALCSNPGGTDNFSRFDQAYPALAPYLAKTMPTTDYTDMWWNPNESGWGLNVIQHPSGNLFVVWFTYGSDGTRTWFVMPGGMWSSSNVWTGTLYATTGSAANAAFNPATLQVNTVGSATLSFSNASNGTWSYTVNGTSGYRSVTRQSF